MRGPILLTLLVGNLSVAGCATELSAPPEGDELRSPVVFGRAVTVLLGTSHRRYEPNVRLFELLNRRTNERYTVEIGSKDQAFVLQLPAGTYELTRVQISEGPFMSMADFGSAFEVGPLPLTYVGTWRFGIDSPRYGRMMVMSVVQDDQEQAEAVRQVAAQYPTLSGQLSARATLIPNEAESRLYEVMPYPRYLPSFRRHWW